MPERGLRPLKFAKVHSNFAPSEAPELPLEEGETVQVWAADPTGAWLLGVKQAAYGWFPAEFVDLLSDEEAIAAGLMSPSDVGKLFPPPNLTGGSTADLTAAQTRRSHASMASAQSASTLQLSASTASLEEVPPQAGGGGRPLSQASLASQASSQTPGTRNWAAKYKSMPRYSKRVSGTGLDELESAVSSHIKEVLARPASAVNMIPPDEDDSAGSTLTHTPTKKEKDSRKGSLGKKALKSFGGSFSDRSKSTTHARAPFVVPAQRPRWVETMGGPEAVAAMGLDKRAVQRQEVVHEIVATEADYVEDLNTIINVFMNPMKRQKILKDREITIIFSNVEQLLPVNTQLKTMFEERVAQASVVEMIGDIFIRVSDFLKMYTMYCRNHPLALMKLQAVRQTKSVAKFLDQCAATPEARNLNLANFLIKPVQRICKYPLLIREAMKNTDPSHQDYALLQSALLKIETVVTIVNEGARQAENVKEMLEIQSRFTTKINIVEPWRTLLKRASMDLVKKDGERSRRESFLFSDMFVLAKSVGGDGEKLKLTEMVPFDMIYINIPSVGTDHLIEIGHVNAGRYVLALETEKQKAEWIAALKEATKSLLASKNRVSPSAATAAASTASATSTASPSSAGSSISTSIFSSSPSLPEIQSLSAIELPRMDAIAEASARIVQREEDEHEDEDEDVGMLELPKPPAGEEEEDEDEEPDHEQEEVVDDVVVKHEVTDAEAAPPAQALRSFQNQRVSVIPAQPAPAALRPTSLPKSGLRQPMAPAPTLPSAPPPSAVAAASNPVSRGPPPAVAPRPPHLQPPRRPSSSPDEKVDITKKPENVANGSELPALPPLPQKVAAATLGAAEAPGTKTPPAANRRLSQRFAENPFIMNDHTIGPATYKAPPAAHAETASTASSSPAPAPLVAGHSEQIKPPPLTRTATATSSSSIGGTHRNRPVRRAQITDVTRAPQKDYVYHIQVFHDAPADQAAQQQQQQQAPVIRHTYDDFFDLHMQLLSHFPEEAGVAASLPSRADSSAEVDMPGGWSSKHSSIASSHSTPSPPKRIIPELPGQMMYVSEAAAKARIPSLQSYIQGILVLPPKISKSPVTMTFFRSDGKHAMLNSPPAVPVVVASLAIFTVAYPTTQPEKIIQRRAEIRRQSTAAAAAESQRNRPAQ
ncbi:Rho guanine nucleotide exchange factor 4 [Geranomyces variabilis]|nr:Rho guanine nucleotide exchange factor 4 [Geranomyces variabilis]